MTIIEAALNGTNPAGPRSVREITADALACVAAGATIVHNHNDEPMWVADGVHAAAPYLSAWRPVLDAHPDVLFYATQASGGPGIRVELRWSHHELLADAGVLRLGLLDPGSVCLGGDRVYLNTENDARYVAARCSALGLIPSVSIFDPSFLKVALSLELPAGSLFKLYFGAGSMRFGLPPTARALDAYLEMLAGTSFPWLVAVLGGDVVACGLAEAAVRRGGHLRVGLEDYAGPRAPRNAELVREAAALIRSCGERVASPAETLATLGLSRA